MRLCEELGQGGFAETACWNSLHEAMDGLDADAPDLLLLHTAANTDTLALARRVNASCGHGVVPLLHLRGGDRAARAEPRPNLRADLLPWILRAIRLRLGGTEVEVREYLADLAAEFDEPTGRHVERVGRYTETLALALGMDAVTSRILAEAARLHDIGMALLPATRTKEESQPHSPAWRRRRRLHTIVAHPTLSAEEDPVLRLVAEMALYHHEQVDGGGYPRRLRGTAIPVHARICAIADTFDQLTSIAPHPSDWLIAKAIPVIEADAEERFGPDVVEGFRRCIDRLAHIKFEIDGDEAYAGCRAADPPATGAEACQVSSRAAPIARATLSINRRPSKGLAR